MAGWNGKLAISASAIWRRASSRRRYRVSPSAYRRSGNATSLDQELAAGRAETSRAMRGPLPTLGANVHSLVSSPARSLLIRSHFCHSFVRGVDSREMRSSLVTASAAPEDPGRGRAMVLGLNVSSISSASRARAAMASLECLPAFMALRLNGAATPGGCFGRSRGADAGRTARRPAAAAARAGVTNPPAAPRDDAGDSNRLDPATSVALGDRRDVDPPARRC